jgi:hypothetical protein
MRCYIDERFPGSVVEFLHHFINIIICYILKTTVFGKVLPGQTIDAIVSISTAFLAN